MILWLALLTALVANPAHAEHQSRIHWGSVPGAAGYELRVLKDGGEVVKTEKLPASRPKWEGTLPNGAYEYQIRALDWAGRPGQWTKARPLIALPPAPELLAPKESEEILSFD